MMKKKFNIPYRLIISVAAGIVLSKALAIITHLILHGTGTFPPLFKPMFDQKHLIVSLIFHSVYAIAGGFVTAWIAKEQAKRAVFILGTKEAILWIAGILLLWKHNPPWVNITKAVLGYPLAWMGGKIYELCKGKRGTRHVSQKGQKIRNRTV